MFLTADGKPIVGGTYWPPDDKEIDGGKIRGFKTILKTMQRGLRRTNAKELEEQADKSPSATRPLLAGMARGASCRLDRDLVSGAVDELKDEFDRNTAVSARRRGIPRHEFPMPPRLLLLQHEARPQPKCERNSTRCVQSRSTTWPAAASTIISAAAFIATAPSAPGPCRTSRRCSTTTPSCWRSTPSLPGDEEIAVSRECWSKRSPSSNGEMTLPRKAAFIPALDADSEGEEGRFYVWTDEGIEDALANARRAALVQAVSMARTANRISRRSYHILTLPQPLERAGERPQNDRRPARSTAVAAAQEAVRGPRQAAAAVSSIRRF